MIREQLQLNVGQHRRGALAGFGNHQCLIGDFGGIRLAIGHGDHRCTAGLDLFDIAEGFAGTFVVTSDDRKHRCVGGHKREGAVFELARWEPFGVLVADLLAFQRALQSNRNVGSPTDKEVGVAAGVFVDQGLGARGIENRLDVVRKVPQRLDEGPEIAWPVDQLFGEQIAANQLRREGLGCGDPDFGSSTDVDCVITLAGGRRVDRVRQRERAHPAALGASERGRLFVGLLEHVVVVAIPYLPQKCTIRSGYIH